MEEAGLYLVLQILNVDMFERFLMRQELAGDRSINEVAANPKKLNLCTSTLEDDDIDCEYYDRNRRF